MISREQFLAMHIPRPCEMPADHVYSTDELAARWMYCVQLLMRCADANAAQAQSEKKAPDSTIPSIAPD
jgi:hypothetical protein